MGNIEQKEKPKQSKVEETVVKDVQLQNSINNQMNNQVTNKMSNKMTNQIANKITNQMTNQISNNIIEENKNTKPVTELNPINPTASIIPELAIPIIEVDPKTQSDLNKLVTLEDKINREFEEKRRKEMKELEEKRKNQTENSFVVTDPNQNDS